MFSNIEKVYSRKEEYYGSGLMREFERYITLQVLDNLWKEHLHLLDRLRESVYLRGYAQRDPLVEYKKESFNLFEDMMFRMKQHTLEYLFKTEITSEEEVEQEKKEQTKKKKKKAIKYKNRLERRKKKKKSR